MAPVDGSGEGKDLLYGLQAVREALRSRARPLLRILLARHDHASSEITHLAKIAGVPVHLEPRGALDRMVPHGRHQGVLAIVGAKRYVDLEEILQTAKDRGEAPFVVILDGVQDPQNLGAILRSAEAAGVHGVVLPDRRAVGATAAVAKASAGALEYLNLACVPNLSRVIERLKAGGLWIYGLDPESRASYVALDLRGPVALVLGGEGAGIRRGVLEKCDARVSIPMRGRVGSLNVSAATAIVLFEAVRQRSRGRS
ncbi:23S rRNA (guanosine(2251)-2'-O)-methyltransferase RlmB [Candidatus Nitrospira bockiana]